MASLNESETSSATGPLRLESLLITGLHANQNIRLQFHPAYTIFIADNGAGKTTALYFLQCILTNNWRRLLRFEFDHIVIQFSRGNIFRVTRQDIESQPVSGWISRIIEQGVSESSLRKMAAMSRHYSLEDMRGNTDFLRIARNARIPSSRLYEVLIRNFNSSLSDTPLFESSDSPLESTRRFIKEHYRHSVIYLPTYRRVEQELSLLTDAGEKEDAFGTAIRFGMKDVVSRIETAGRRIRDHFVSTYGRVSGEMLHQLANPSQLSRSMVDRLSVRTDVEIVLQRLSDYISEEDRRHILLLHDSNALTENAHLSFFLSNLIAAYEEVRPIERSLQSFGKKCNQYLIRKEFRYDSASAALRIYDKDLGSPLELSTLSSGEKQIVGVLSQVYLGEEESYVVIFDEPELSLSVEWQRRILPDIADAEKCFALIAATHSPFIFENELDDFAVSVGLEDYVEQTVSVEVDGEQS